MKRLVAVTAFALALAMGASPASAQYWSSSGPVTGDGYFTFGLGTSTSYTCSAQTSPVSATSPTNTLTFDIVLSPGDFHCWTYIYEVPGHTTTMVARSIPDAIYINVKFDVTPGYTCQGTAYGTFESYTGTATFPQQYIGVNLCLFEAELYFPGLSIT